MNRALIRACLFCGIIFSNTTAQNDPFAAFLDPLVDELFIPGYYLAVFDNSGMIYERSRGFADETDNIAPTKDVLYSVQSLTKPLTSLLLLRLNDLELVDLDAPVSDYLPEFSNMILADNLTFENGTSPSLESLTVNNLLTHTSGLTYSSSINGISTISNMYRNLGIFEMESERLNTLGPLKEHVKKLTELDLISPPGERFNYSVSLDVAGRLAEVATGIPFSDALKKYILEPLNMTSSYFRVPEEQFQTLSRLYIPLIRTYPIPGNYRRFQEFKNMPGGYKNFGQSENLYESGGHGLITTGDDYGKFLKFILNYDPEKDSYFLSESTFDAFLTHQLPNSMGPEAMENSLPELSGKGFSYGLGITLSDGGSLDDTSTYDYYFWNAAPEWSTGTNSHFWIDRDLGLGLIFLSSLMSADNLITDKTHGIAEEFFGSK
jgi:CubicO group peptidase (beta-lactamase class C family)